MLPNFDESQIKQEQIQKPQTPTNLIKSLQSNVSIHPKISLIITLLFIQLLVIVIFRSSPIQFSTRTIFPSPNIHVSQDPGDCSSGKVYVYDLPEIYNIDLLSSCDDLHTWRWQCGIGTNRGFGRRADELDGILPADLASSWYRTSQFSSEVIFHNRILNYRCRTFEPESATAVYIPFYAALAVGKYLFSEKTVRERDLQCEMLLRWVQEQPSWNRFNGSDHFTVLGRITWDFRRLTDPIKHWGSSFLNMHAMQNVTHLSIERAPWDYNDVGIPYPTGFHPNSNSDLIAWQTFVASHRRTRLFSYIGATRAEAENDVRGVLMNQCKAVPGACRSVDCAVTPCTNDSSAILASQLDGEFCLQPKGDSFTRRSVFDCMIAGSIPVFFWNSTAYDQYQWFLPAEPESYSVYIDYKEVLNGTSIKGVLANYSGEQVKKMREKVIETIPRIVYANSSEGLNFKDAFVIAVEGVLNRINIRRGEVHA